MSSNETKCALMSQTSLEEPKYAKMVPNEPKQAQKNLNIFKIILYELKMGLNELK